MKLFHRCKVQHPPNCRHFLLLSKVPNTPGSPTIPSQVDHLSTAGANQTCQPCCFKQNQSLLKKKNKHTKCVSENWVISANCHVLIIKRIRISFFKDFSLVFHGFPEVFSCHRQFVQLPPSCLNWKSGLGCASEGTQSQPSV